MGRKLANFAVKKEYAVFCPVGQASLAEAIELMSRAVRRCRDQKIEKLLIDSTGLAQQLHPPGIVERYHFAERIATEARSSVKIAHVANPEWVRAGKFAVLVAKNRGLEAQNFTSRAAAREWLLKPAGARSEARD